MPRPEPRLLTVIDSARITPNMIRVTLGGEGLAGFPQDESGGYIKIMPSGSPEGGKRIVRTYTIRSQTENTLDVDFALHGNDEASGPATDWAINAKPGDTIKLGGPGDAKPLPAGNGPFLLVGDMTALPAISVNLEGLSADATGRAIILIRDEADKQEIEKPEGVSIEWIVENDLGADPTLLAQAARQVPDVDQLDYAWIACEFESMKQLRQFLRTEQGFGKERLYISSYWKRGVVEDEHKMIKRVDAQSVG